MHNQAYRTIGLITLISALVFIPFLGAIPLFDWDEVNFAEVAREMILTGDYSRPYIDFVPFWEKPPLFFWLQALSMQLWGIGEFAARFPNAICGVVTLNVLYLIGRKLYDHRFGILWVLAYGGSILPHLYFRSGIIDPWFNLFIFVSIYYLSGNIWAEKTTVEGRKGGMAEGRKGGMAEGRKGGTAEGQKGILRQAQDRERAEGYHIGRSNLIFGGCFLGLAVLTKGPVAYLIVLLVVGVYWMIERSMSQLNWKHFALYTLMAALTFGVWYGVETIKNGTWFITEFTRYQIDLLVKPGAGHAGFPGYHVVVLLLGCFPASIFAIQPLFRRIEDREMQNAFKLWMSILLIVVIVLFSLVQSKIVHYSSLCYFPITFHATQYLWQLHKQGKGIGGWQRTGVIFIAAFYVIAGIALIVIGRKPELIYDLIDDVHTKASITLYVSWQRWRALPVVFLLAAIISLITSRKYKNVVMMYVFTAAFICSGIYCWVGNVQQYSQGPSTEFFRSLRGKDVYVIPWGHKSYSQYWDFRKPMPEEFSLSDPMDMENTYRKYADPDYLLSSSEINKNVYVVTKVSKMDEFQSRYPEVGQVEVSGGFALFLRSAK